MLILHEGFKYKKRFRLWPVATITDIADYKIGWIFTLRPFFIIIKVKVSKIMDAPRYITVIEIFWSNISKGIGVSLSSPIGADRALKLELSERTKDR